jgi:hypothetical protein
MTFKWLDHIIVKEVLGMKIKNRTAGGQTIAFIQR